MKLKIILIDFLIIIFLMSTCVRADTFVTYNTIELNSNEYYELLFIHLEGYDNNNIIINSSDKISIIIIDSDNNINTNYSFNNRTYFNFYINKTIERSLLYLNNNNNQTVIVDYKIISYKNN